MFFLANYVSDNKIGMVTEFITNHVNPNNHHIHKYFVVASALIVFIIFAFLYNKKKGALANRFNNLLEVFVIFVRDNISIANLGEKDGRKWTGFFCTVFFFVLAMNLIGLIPGSYTPTGNYSVTLTLAICIFFVMTVVALFKNGIRGWLSAFIPSNVNPLILLILVPIEFAGIFIKAIALMIRLFANMLAGHIILFSILALIYVFNIIGFIAFPVSIAIYALELFVAFLQAYIFVYLSAMFIGQIFHPDH